MMKILQKVWKIDERQNRAFERALGDFNLDFESLEGAIQDIERRISRYVEREGRS